MAKMVEQ